MSQNYHSKHKKDARHAVILTVGALAVLALLGLAGRYLILAAARNAPSGSGGSSQEQQKETDESSPALSGTDDGPETPDPPEEPVQPPVSSYDFSQPVPESAAVDNSYFSDAAFVGDSRTDGFMIYSGIGTGKNLTSNGLSIFQLEEKKALTIEGEEYTLLEALGMEQYGKVYLSLGVNELGVYNDEGFYQSYCDAIDQIRALQPNAVIYIQGLIPLNEEEIAETTGRTYLTNEHLRVYNDLMRQTAEEKQVAFLDLYTEFADENGALPANASRDGVHLYKEYCQRWLEYLKTHTVEFDELYPGGAAQPAERSGEE